MENLVINDGIGLNDSGRGEVIPSVAIDRILAQRAEGLKLYSDGLAMLEQSRELLKSASMGEHLYGFGECVTRAINGQKSPAVKTAIQRLVDRRVWDTLLNKTGMYTFMSSAQRDEWRKQLEGDDMPEISLETVTATFRQLNAGKQETFEEGIIDVFRKLSWDYKTNHPCKLGKKIIINRFLDVYGVDYVSLSTTGREKLDDLARPFYLLDGKNVPDFRDGEGCQARDFIAHHGLSGDVWEGEYFSVKYFKKGSAHITFKRPELVEKVNDIIARRYPGALPSRC